MKIKMTTKTDPVFAPKDGWRVDNDYDQYLDVSTEVFSFASSEFGRTNEKDYVVMRVTFVRATPDSDEFISAYITLTHNVPSGDHNEWGDIKITVEEGVRLCLREVK